MTMDRHSYRQHISEEPDRFESRPHYEDEENLLHYRQIRQEDDYNIFSNEDIFRHHFSRSSSSFAARYRQHCDATNINSIGGNKDESDLLVDPQVQGPFMATLPPSLLTSPSATLPSPLPDVAALKRGLGRPRSYSKKQLPSPHPPNVIDAAKRGPGDSNVLPLPPSPPPSDAVVAGSLFFKNRSTSISLIITPTVTTRARAMAQSIRRVQLRVTDPSLASASSFSNANATATKAVNAASIQALRPVLPVTLMPNRQGPGRPKGSKSRWCALLSINNSRSLSSSL
ncbi:hypothetical protein K457DRAFT_18868 [Linnemannia elongata AG-77]|uniref:Uncharacterized protein n=1 Tax=Linnemannia elongata AG-77 TaxID=1314771 RepID=A0A197JWI8_9FUNG|nr:hypothetical protein K457DRAFT_18868 [Linnemannia elongata AG-77]